MEFKTLRNIENSFKQIRLYAIVFAVLCTSVVGYV
ncbi:MAG: conjugative transposon protein TraK, partial [Sphingobacterium sp.]